MSSVVWQILKKFIDTMFISNDRPSFRLCWKESLGNHQKASKYYAIDCLQNFLWLLMSLLAVKNSHVKARINLIFLKNFQKQNWNFIYTTFWSHLKDPKSSYRVRLILAFFCNLTTLILGLNSLKGIKVTEIG